MADQQPQPPDSGHSDEQAADANNLKDEDMTSFVQEDKKNGQVLPLEQLNALQNALEKYYDTKTASKRFEVQISLW